MNFGGFRRAINRLGCVYIDVDRRYFNDNTGPGPNYATIDLKPGYQKLCGSDALDYVRFRHDDSDFVRAARQQALPSQAKEQVGLGKLFKDRKELLRIFGSYTETDIADSDTAEILGLIKLAYASSKSPVTEIEFPATDCEKETCVEIEPEELANTVVRLHRRARRSDGRPDGAARSPSASGARRSSRPAWATRRRRARTTCSRCRCASTRSGCRSTSRRRSASSRAAGYAKQRQPALVRDLRPRQASATAPTGSCSTRASSASTTASRARPGRHPPILDNPTDERIIGGRKFRRYFAGKKIKLMAWETPKAVYWVSNTLSLKLTNRQMIEIARSLKRI